VDRPVGGREGDTKIKEEATRLPFREESREVIL